MDTKDAGFNGNTGFDKRELAIKVFTFLRFLFESAIKNILPES